MPKAYSYIRFSSTEQAEGDSLRRQTELARAYAEKHDLTLADLTFRDLGVSAFRGSNIFEGALGAFIAAVDSSKVKPGDHLLVESLDRLSRDRIWPAMQRFAALLSKGIIIVTLSDGQRYDIESINNLSGMLVPLVSMSRANEESEMKSQRGRAAWDTKRELAASEGKIITTSAPGWIKAVNGKFEIIPERAAIVRRIFKLAATGHGKIAICRILNGENIETFGRGNSWWPAYVGKVLSNVAVLGHFQPRGISYKDGKESRVDRGELIEGYFPAIITPAVFYRVKHQRGGITGRTRTGLPRNLLGGMVVCAKCGGACHHNYKGVSRGSYLVCDNKARRGTCDAVGVDYFGVFYSALSFIHGNYSTFDKRNGEDDTEQARELEGIEGQIAETEAVIERLIDSLERVSSTTMENRLSAKEKLLVALTAKHTEVREQAEKDNALKGPTDLTNIEADVRAALEEPTGDDDIAELTERRVHIAAEIKRIIDKITVVKGGPVEITPKEGSGFKFSPDPSNFIIPKTADCLPPKVGAVTEESS